MTTEDSANSAKDDLTRIKGIGPTRQDWLARVFDVHSFADLADLSIDRIEAELKAEKRSTVTRSDIQDWLVKAGELAAADAASRHAAEPIDPASEEAPAAASAADSAGDTDLQAPSDTALPPAADIAVQLKQLQIRQPQAGRPVSLVGQDQTFSGFVRSAEPFTLDAAFSLIGQDAADLAERELPFVCQFYVRDLRAGATIHLGDSIPGSLTEGRLSYGATLFHAKLPKGAYRLQVLVIVQSTPPVPGHLEVPILQVL